MKLTCDLQRPYFTVDNINIQDVSRPRGYKHGFKGGRPKNAFILTQSGMMEDIFSDGSIISASAGELVFIPAGTIYTGRYAEDNTRIKIVQFDLVENELPKYLSAPRKLPLYNAEKYIGEFFKRESEQSGAVGFYHLACLYQLLGRVCEECGGIPQKYRKLGAAIGRLNSCYAENRPISYYAELCDMSEVNFRRLFSEFFGMPPIEYRNELRLLDAREKLRSGEYNVTEVANALGFSNISFFIKLYKKKFGHTPKKE